MKKIYSLIKSSMTNDMNLFKIKKSKKNKQLIPILLALYLMFMIWSAANGMYEKLEGTNVEYLILSILVFSISLLTIMEGIYKIGPILFNCKDDDLLLSLPINKKTILFTRIFKFYIFELLYNSLFLLPVMISYIRWGNINWTYYLTSIIMLFILPIIPIIISCIIGIISSSITSRFKYKNFVQIVISMILILGILILSFKIDSIFTYVAKHASSINEMITKIYYPAGVYAKLLTDFSFIELIKFIIVNIVLLIITIYILSIFYYKINSRLKNITTTKKTNINNINIKSNTVTKSLIKKEINTFFKTPVFIINAGFALVLFIIAAVMISIKFESIVPLLEDPNTLNISKDLINNNLSIIILLLIIFASFMTSITNSVISLEGKNINILKSLPIDTRTILMSKIYSALTLTTPVLLVGELILFIKFKISIFESLSLLILSILLPLVSHFIGLIINLKYPKLDAENSTEVVKQSASSLISVTIGMLLLVINITIIAKIIGNITSTLLLLIHIIIYLVLDIGLYLYLTKVSTKEFNKLTI